MTFSFEILAAVCRIPCCTSSLYYSPAQMFPSCFTSDLFRYDFDDAI